MEDAAAYLVAKSLTSNDGNLIADAFVGLEVKGEFGIVPLDDHFGRFLDRLRSDNLVSIIVKFAIWRD
jgi:hypothetical protein